jgi:hypothetical protein
VTNDELIEEIRELLDELVDRVRQRVPDVLAGARYDGAMQPYASFAATASSESLDLCVVLRPRQDGAIECIADLVAGGTGDVLAEMATVVCTGATDVKGTKRLLAAVRAFCASQEDRVVGQLRGGS